MNGLLGNSVVYVDGARTPFARAGTDLAHARADDLMVKVFRELARRNPSLPLDRVDDVAVAAATQTGDQGMNIGRSTALLAGMPSSVPGYSVDRWCAGAMTAATSLASGIAAGAYHLTLAGGVEMMSSHPMGEGIDPNPRYIAERLVDTDALVMGATAEVLHDRFAHLTRSRADEFALASQQRTARAYKDSLIQPDLVPTAAPSPDGWTVLREDTTPRPNTTLEALSALKTPFRAAGRVTAGNASPLTDGAAGVILASEQAAQRFDLPARMRMVSFAYAGVDPEVMGIGPIPATEKALSLAGLTFEDLDLFEINEAFAVQVLSFTDHFSLPDLDPRLNPLGGAIAVGHPLAASGARLFSNLARSFAMNPSARYGLTAMCVGLGMGGAVIWERL